MMDSSAEKEGLRAQLWRQRFVRLTRRQLADILQIDPRTIERHEQMLVVPTLYRLACDTIDRTRSPTWAWTERKNRAASVVATDSTYRRRRTLSGQPNSDNEGLRAIWWREEILGYSRPQLAKALDVSSRTVTRYESMERIHPIYRCACDTISRNRNPTWSWQQRDQGRSLAMWSNEPTY